MDMKAEIIKVGTVDENGTLRNWAFYGGEAEVFLEDGTPLFGGYTLDELRAIAAGQGAFVASDAEWEGRALAERNYVL